MTSLLTFVQGSYQPDASMRLSRFRRWASGRDCLPVTGLLSAEYHEEHDHCSYGAERDTIDYTSNRIFWTAFDCYLETRNSEQDRIAHRLSCPRQMQQPELRHDISDSRSRRSHVCYGFIRSLFITKIYNNLSIPLYVDGLALQ